MARSVPSLEAFSKVVEAIYDCALHPEHWRDTLRMMGRHHRYSQDWDWGDGLCSGAIGI